MLSGCCSDGKCKCLVIVRSASPPSTSSLTPSVVLVVVEGRAFKMLKLFLFLLSGDVVVVAPLLVAFDDPSAVISHEEMMREARMYCWPAPTLRKAEGRKEGMGAD